MIACANFFGTPQRMDTAYDVHDLQEIRLIGSPIGRHHRCNGGLNLPCAFATGHVLHGRPASALTLVHQA